MKAAIKVLHAIFLVLCLGYLAYALLNEGNTIAQLFLQSNPFFVLPSLFIWPFGVMISAWFSSQVISSTGSSVEYKNVLSIYLSRIPAKYLPGGVWQTFARAYDLSALGLEKSRIAVLVFYENFWTVLLAGLISCPIIIFISGTNFYKDIAMLILLACLCLIPIAFFFRQKIFVLSVQDYFKLTASGLTFWCVAGSSFILYLHAFDSVLAPQSTLTLFGNYLFSYVIGFISIFTPQGIGVFEFVMTQLTDFSILQSQALILLAGFRIIVLLGDMIAWITFLIIKRTGYFQSGENINDELQDL